MSEYSVACPWCGTRLLIQPGGWAFQRSQIVLHLTGCPQKPDDCTAADFNITADAIIDSVSEK